MVQFANLRLSGFKSFVEAVDLSVVPGLTAIVGPNGCGKSNLIEALSWVMGENSAKRMRGGEMDDVIFSGTASRPARNLADVIVSLDNSDRSAPSLFNDTDAIEVSRRIVRGHGSTYRVNGKEVRARDVQLLFADIATGPHSAAMVSQGRVGAIINAKPVQRRALLEEAAGITGLHSRRHEAELRLRAAETNLERLDDVIATLEAQQQGLKKQARQATRYKNINAQVRRLEAILLHLRSKAATAALADAEARMAEGERQVAAASQKAAEQARIQAEVAARLPELRQAEAEAAAALQRLLIDRDSLDREAERTTAQRAQAEERLRQIEGDRERAARLLEDAAEADGRLAREREALELAEENEREDRERAQAEAEAARGAVAQVEESFSDLAGKVAADEARTTALKRQVETLTARVERLKEELSSVASERETLEGERLPAGELEASKVAIEEAEGGLGAAREAIEEASRISAARREGEESCRETLRQDSEAVAKAEAEVEALTALLEAGEPDMWPAMVDALMVESGMETALGSALGDDLAASSDEAAPVHWETFAPYDSTAALPDGAEPLSRWVGGPPALARRLSQIGIVADEATALRLQPSLEPGQRLTTRNGGLWRWDGYTAKADAPTAAASRLEQRNRLEKLRGPLEELRAAREAARAAHQEAKDGLLAAEQTEKEARLKLDDAFAALDAARNRRGELAQSAAALDSRVAALRDREQRLGSDLGESEQSLATAMADLESLANLEAARAELQELRETLQERRDHFQSCQEQLHALLRESEGRGRRMLAIDSERTSWHDRAEEARGHGEELDAREKSVRAELTELASLPAEMEERRHRLADLIESAEELRKEAADALVASENRQAEAGSALKAAEIETQNAREDRVRAEAALEHGREAISQLQQAVAEKLECGLEGVLEAADIGPEEPLPDAEEAENKLARILRERENMGPVNLRAESEAEELELRITGMQGERRDLVSAIARLRQGIGSLNREGRERLLAAFEAVNTHFSELFVRLFGGGRAFLSLTEAEDPLDAGLEIMASPPGKRLQVMSLLSGGEQALTALSLLFAVFLTNPAPICVLDEVDAPLDDANVDRLCSLLEEMVSTTSTRFLLITHHRMTMARADRLYGVTMSERGVSQLVSVDFDTASSLRETA